jgi:hypothetical protein
VASVTGLLHDNRDESTKCSQKCALFPNLSSSEQFCIKLFFTQLMDLNLEALPHSVTHLGGTYIYMAFAEHPFKYATGR